MCNIEWCNNTQIIGKSNLCRNHYNQMSKYGKILNDRPKGKRNEYVIKDDYAELLILDKNGNLKVKAIVDIEDIDMLKEYSFRYEKDKYIKGFKNNKTIYLHQIIAGKEEGLEVDHINRNKLDNRKSNLRIVDRKTNANNITRRELWGILKTHNKTNPYRLSIKNKHYGYFKTFEEALDMRNKVMSNNTLKGMTGACL